MAASSLNLLRLKIFVGLKFIGLFCSCLTSKRSGGLDCSAVSLPTPPLFWYELNYCSPGFLQYLSSYLDPEESIFQTTTRAINTLEMWVRLCCPSAHNPPIRSHLNQNKNWSLSLAPLPLELISFYPSFSYSFPGTQSLGLLHWDTFLLCSQVVNPFTICSNAIFSLRPALTTPAKILALLSDLKSLDTILFIPKFS